jgi:hypothetical protein
MDSILTCNRLLVNRSWLFFKLYKDPQAPTDLITNLNWYHQTLINVVRPIINGNPNISSIFFGLYGPEPYDTEDERYVNRLTPPASNVVFIRLRVATKKGKKNNVKNAFLTSVAQNTNLVWNCETMVTWNVANDLGTRYGSSLANQTLEFIRYWDAACRYILSILVMPGNWKDDVDVWGVPHLVNNSMGGWLRTKGNPRICPNCQANMYMSTTRGTVISPTPITNIETPLFVFVCPRCGYVLPNEINI